MTKIIVAHPYAQHSFQLAVGLQQAGLLHSMITRLYTSWEHWPFSCMCWLPAFIKKKIEINVFRRYRHVNPDLNPHSVRVFDTAGVLVLLAFNRLGLFSRKQWEKLLLSTAIHFQVHASKLAVKEACALVCYDCYAEIAFKALERSNVIKVLDLSAAHPKFIRGLLESEKKLQPRYASSLDWGGISVKSFERFFEETERANAILVGSNFVKQTCVDAGVDPQKVFVVPYGVDIQQFKKNITPKSQHSKFRAIFVGQITQRKGISYLLEAFKALPANKFELYLYGKIMIDSDILLEYEQNVHYLGYVAHNKLAEMYQDADVLIQPSLHEGFSQVILEAMACGLPVIATTNTGGEDVIIDGENGYVIPIRDSGAIVEKVSFLYKNPELCAVMGVNARKTAEHYSWQRYYKQVSDIMGLLVA